MNNKLSIYYFYAIIAYVIPIVGYINTPGSVGVYTIISAILLLCIYIILKRKRVLEYHYFDKRLRLFSIVILIGILNSLSRGPNDWDSISLLISSIISYVLIIYCFLVQDVSSIKNFLMAFLYLLIPTAVYSYLNWDGFLSYDVPHILAPFSLFFLVIPFIKNKVLRIIIAAVYLVSFLIDTSVRSCLLSGTICSFLLIAHAISTETIFFVLSQHMRRLFFAVPVVLLCLGLWGEFNVFAEIENIDVSNFGISDGRKSDSRMLNTDSRTGVYLDVLHSVDGIRDILIGKGEVINLDSSWTELRHSVEVGMLNIFLKYGLMGCIAFFLLLWHSTKLGVYETNNTMTRIVALYLSYKFLYMFIEDASINISTVLAYAICVNSKIRSLTDIEIRNLLK